MTHYYENHPFSDAQVTHAAEVVERLIKERRFFLHHHSDKSWGDDPDYTLNPEVFADAIALDEAVREAYREARRVAETSIFDTEEQLGVVKPNLSGNKQVVQCSRYTGGFDICRVYPVTAFTDFIPQTQDALVTEHFNRMMGDRTEDDLSPKVVREYGELAEKLATTIWTQFEAFEAHDPDNHRCLVMLESRVDMGGCSDVGDFAGDRLLDMQDHPHAVGYLFHAYCKQTRIVRHNYVVSSTSRKSHVRFEHWNDDKPPALIYAATQGYSCSVKFATVL